MSPNKINFFIYKFNLRSKVTVSPFQFFSSKNYSFSIFYKIPEVGSTSSPMIH